MKFLAQPYGFETVHEVGMVEINDQVPSTRILFAVLSILRMRWKTSVKSLTTWYFIFLKRSKYVKSNGHVRCEVCGCEFKTLTNVVALCSEHKGFDGLIRFETYWRKN